MGTFKVEGDINITGSKTNINYGTPQYCSNQTNIKATTGLNICQGNDETSGIQLNGDYITMWSPADSYCLRYYDEDSGNEIWNINSSGLFSGTVSWSNISSKPSTFTPSSHTHDYLSLNGGTVTGTITLSNNYPFKFTNVGNNNAYLAADSQGLFLAVYGSSNKGKSVYIETYDTGIYHRRSDTGTNYEILTAANYSNWALPISGGTIQSTAANTLSINTTYASTNYIRLANNNSNKVTLGYYLGLAFIANEVGNYARIGVNDSGVPQYWTTNTTSGGIYDLIHSGGGTMTGKLNYPSDVGGGVVWGGAFDHEPDLTQNCSMLATYMDSSNKWWNIISCRHRNGSSDGKSYGMYFKTPLTGSWAHLTWNRQYGNSWQGERTIHDTGNVCISSSNPGNGSFYGQIWLKI